MGRLQRARWRWAALAAVVVAIAGTGGALAAYPQDSVAVFTGCLQTAGTGGGQISAVAVSATTPLRPCSPNQALIHFSGGTITQVTAGAGLTGGGNNGYVTLSLASSYQLPQGCTTGKIVKWNGSAWVCGDQQTYTNGTGLDLSGNTFSVDPGYQLPQSCGAGQLVKSNGSNTWACEDAPSGSSFVLTGQSCGTGEFVTGSDGSGNTVCGNDKTYSGSDFATSGQDCPSGQFANGIDSSGKLKCASPPSFSHDLWWNQAVADQPCCDRLDDLVTKITVPQGNYLINASIHVLNNDGDNQADSCWVLVPGGTKLGGIRQVYLAPQTSGGSQAWIPVAQPFTGSGEIDVYCNLFNAVAGAEITALQVGTIQGSGN
jgi:hypothetical protein